MNSSSMMLSLLPMLWAFVLTMACGTAWLGTRHNARLEERYGLEVEALKSAARSDNTVLATYLWRRTAQAIKAGEASRTSTDWSRTNVVYDGSLSGGDSGSAEIVSPPLIGRPSLRGWVRALGTAIAGVMRIDSSCGLHTHIGLRDPNGSFDNQNNGPTSLQEARNLGVRVAVMYYNYLRAFHGLVSPSRRHNHYGGMQRFNDRLQGNSVSSTWDHTNSRGVRSYFGENWATRTDNDKQAKYLQAFETLAFDRYLPVNLTTVAGRGTIEFRLHQGTINANKMYAWAHLHYLFVAACMDEAYWWEHLQHLARRRRYTANHDRLGNLNDLLSFVGLSESDPLADYLQARARFIAGEGPEVPSPWMPSSEEAAANTDLYRAHVAYETRDTTHPLTTRDYTTLSQYLQISVEDDWDDWDGEATARMTLVERAFDEDLHGLNGHAVHHYATCEHGTYNEDVDAYLGTISLENSLAHNMHTTYWNGSESAERDYRAMRIYVQPHNNGQFRIDGQYRCLDCGCFTDLRIGFANGYDPVTAEEPTFPDYDPNYMVAGAVSLLMGLAPWVMALGLAIGCGIGAIHKANNRAFPKSKWFVRLHNALTSRGKQAAGWTISDGKTNVTDKRPVSAHALAKNTHKAIRGNKTVWGMMHTRYATHGVNNSDNAHPHFGPDGHVTMVHNGVVHNHDKVWNGLGLTPTGPVDSQAVAAALEVGGITKVVELCEGSMSLIWNDRRDADHTALHWWTNGGNPLAFGRLGNATGPIVVGSTIEHLKTSFGKHLHSVYDCVVGRHYRTTDTGAILSEDIAGSAATAYTSYDWRTYSSLRVNTDKKGKSAATCEAPHTWDLSGQRSNDLWSLRGLTLKQHIANQYDSVLRWGERGWAPGEFDGDRYDGYDAYKHAGVVQDPVSGDYYEYYLPSNVHPDPYEDDNLDWEWVALGDFRDVLADDIANNEPESSWVWDADPGMW